MRKNIVYFSGTHGSGKSTLIDTLIERHPTRFQKFEKLKIPKDQDTYDRTIIRATRSYTHTFYQNQQAEQEPEKILLCDRCINDEYGYMIGFIKMKMVSEEQFKNFLELCKILFPQERRPENIIYFDLPLDIIIRNIRKRWEETGTKKWREEDFKYLDATRLGFQEFYRQYQGNVLHLQADNLEERIEMVCDWIDRTILGQEVLHQKAVGQEQ